MMSVRRNAGSVRSCHPAPPPLQAGSHLFTAAGAKQLEVWIYHQPTALAQTVKMSLSEVPSCPRILLPTHPFI
jgi:hypothetical protein